MSVWNKDMTDRKKGHVDICLNNNINYNKKNGFENYDFIHNALPEIDFNKISTQTEFLGKKIELPLIISGMTGGLKLGGVINKNLAISAEKFRVAMGVGSQRVAFKNPDLSESFQIRKYAPNIPLLANLGAVQLNYGFTVHDCIKAVKDISADSLVLHLNSMQEVIQQSDVNYEDLLQKIKEITGSIGYPVIVKEVGFGISGEAGEKLQSAGVYGLDVSGSGGTSWTAVESYLAEPPYDAIGKLFWDWGIPTATCLEMNKRLKVKIIAGGGIKTGLDIAKAIALGADYVSLAGVFLKAAIESPDKVLETLNRLQLELKVAMFGIGAKSISELKHNKALVKSK